MNVAEQLIELESGRLIARMESKVKGDLAEKSSELLSDFFAFRNASSVDDQYQLITFYNLASLYQFAYGEFDRAEDLCKHASRICLALAERESSAGWTVQAIQPYINIGRIAATRGDLQKAISIFREVFSFINKEEDLMLGDRRVSASMVDRLVHASPTLPRLCRSVYLMDSIRALLISRDHDGLLSFLDLIESYDEYNRESAFQLPIIEARARALLGLGDHRGALALLNQFMARVVQEKARYPGIALHALIAGVYSEMDAPSLAKKVLASARKHVEKLTNCCPEMFQTVYLISLSEFICGERNSALATAHIALESARQLNDQVGELKAAVLLLGIDSARDSAGDSTEEFAGFDAVYNRLQSLAPCTFYRLERAVAYARLAAKEPGSDTVCPTDLTSKYLNDTECILRSLYGGMKGIRREWLRKLAESLDTELNSRYVYSPNRFNSYHHEAIDNVYLYLRDVEADDLWTLREEEVLSAEC
ncbi:MAG TPA: hypothetical protein VKM94_16265 [Blastocatellia bacterium]|nr:hypothetical protein [Blastocatellia bacterium]